MPQIAAAAADTAQSAVIVPATNYFLSMHTADPGAAGASEGTVGRMAITFGASSGAVQTSSSGGTYPAAPGGQTYTHFGVWSAASGGTYLRGGTLTAPITPGAGSIINVAPGAITLTAA